MEIQPEEFPCAQCGRGFPASAFLSQSGKTLRNCKGCRELYKPGNYGIRGSVPRRLLRVFAEEPKVTWAQKSGNKKLGGIPGAEVDREATLDAVKREIKEARRSRFPYQLQMFVKHLWPVFVEELKKELRAEAFDRLSKMDSAP